MFDGGEYGRDREPGLVPQSILFATILGIVSFGLIGPTALDSGLAHQLAAWLAESLDCALLSSQLEGSLIATAAMTGMTLNIFEESDEDQDDMFYPRTSPFEAHLKKSRTVKRIKELIVPPFLQDENNNSWANQQLGLTVLYDHLTHILVKSQPGIPFFIDLVKYFNELTLMNYQGVRNKLNQEKWKNLTESVIERFHAKINRIYSDCPLEVAENIVATAIRYSLDLENGLRRFPIGGTPYTKVLDGGDEPYELRRYDGVDETNGHVLLVYALVNKADILDYAPHLNRSVIRSLNRQGITVYLLYWEEPQQDYELADYYRWIHAAIQTVSAQIKREKINCIGYCQGGAINLMALNAKVISPDQLAKLGLLASPIDTSRKGIKEAALEYADVVTGQDINTLRLSQKGKWPLAEDMNTLVATAVATWGRRNQGLLDGSILSLYILLRDAQIYEANTIGVFEEMIDYLVNKPGVIEWVQKHAADFSSPRVEERLDQLTAMIAAAIADGDVERLYGAYPGIKVFIGKRPENLHRCLELLVGPLNARDEDAMAEALQAFIDSYPAADYLKQMEANKRPAAAIDFVLRRFPELRDFAMHHRDELAQALCEAALNPSYLGVDMTARHLRQFAVEVKNFLSGVTLRRWMWDTPDMALTAWITFNQFLYIQNRFVEDPAVRQNLREQLTNVEIGMIIGTKDDVVPPDSAVALLTLTGKKITTFIADKGHVALVMSGGVLKTLWAEVGTWLLEKGDPR